MKTSTKNLISATLCALVLSSSVFIPAASAIPASYSRKVTPDVKRIIVDGNIDLLIVQNKKSGVIVNSETQMSKLKVTQKGNILRISSDDSKRAQLTVYVNEIYRIEASGDAAVKTHGKLNLKFLQVFLSDSATADINADTEGLYTVINDKSKLNLTGNTTYHALVMGKVARLTMQNFAASRSDVSYSDAVAMIGR